MDELKRECAPVCAQAWHAIDEEARATLTLTLAARKIVDFEGPLGWDASAKGLGRIEPLKTPPLQGAQASLRQVQPLVEFRVPFELSRSELDAIARGAGDADLSPVKDAAKIIACAEDRAVFHGYKDGLITGIGEAAGKPLSLTERYEDYPNVIAAALAELRLSGINGPYAIALGPKCYTGLTESTEKGFPVLPHVEQLIDGPIIWAPGLDGAAVVSMRGGDYELIVGRDMAVGYLDHTPTHVSLYIEESFTFRVLSPEAAVLMVHTS